MVSVAMMLMFKRTNNAGWDLDRRCTMQQDDAVLLKVHRHGNCTYMIMWSQAHIMCLPMKGSTLASRATGALSRTAGPPGMSTSTSCAMGCLLLLPTLAEPPPPSSVFLQPCIYSVHIRICIYMTITPAHLPTGFCSLSKSQKC